MRQMTYTRELDCDGYVVHGYNRDFRDRTWSDDFKPIQMELTGVNKISKERQEMYWDRILKTADSDLFGDPDQADFTENHAAIIKGKRPDWQLSAFRVSVGIIGLFYNNIETKENAFLWITGNYGAKLTFRCAKNHSGFKTTYCVECYHNKSIIKEDLGYIRSEAILRLKNPEKTDDNLFHDWNTIIETTEYAGV